MKNSYLSKRYLPKKAGELGDIAVNTLNPLNYIPYVNAPYVAGVIPGVAHGTLAAADDEDIKEMNKRGLATALVPGVAASRRLRRARNIAKGTKFGNANISTEMLGSLVSPLATGALGALAGGMIGRSSGVGAWDKYRKGTKGAMIGAGIGVSAPVIAAAALALINRRRTEQEQLDYDNQDNLISHLLVPGKALYDRFKREGRIFEKEKELNA